MSSVHRNPLTGWRLPTDLVEQIQRLAEINRRTPTQEARVALEQYIERNNNRPVEPRSRRV